MFKKNIKEKKSNEKRLKVGIFIKITLYLSLLFELVSLKCFFIEGR